MERFHDQTLSDFGVYSGPEELKAEFDAEVKAIRECLHTLGYTPGLAKWQQSKDPNIRLMYEGLNLRGDALSMWEQIAFPLRRRGGVLFRIAAPRDVIGGTPIVDAVAIDDFIRGVSARTAKDREELAHLRERLDF